MTQDQYNGVVRAVLAGIGGVAVALGWVGDATWQSIAGAAIIVATSLWSVWSKKV